MYEGHQFIKVCGDNWVFDITEFVGYKVIIDKDKETVKEYKVAYQAIDDGSQIIFEKFIGVPAKVLKETVDVIEKYEKELMIV